MGSEWTMLLAVIGQAAETAPVPEISAWSLIWQAGPMVKFVLIVLAFFSVFSWAIIGFKFFQLQKAQKESKQFLQSFWAGESLEQVSISTKRFTATPLASIFRAGFSELEQFRRGHPKDEEISLLEVSKGEMGMENVARALKQAATTELNRMTRFLSFLATTGSTAPFIGLFGTVWGIMNSFQHISVMKGAGFEVVGRGISEALIATAVGLVAAIPAVVAYNYFLSGIRALQTELENFQAEFLNIIERHYLKKRLAGKRAASREENNEESKK